MSRTGDAVIYLTELEGMTYYQFAHEIYTSLSKAKTFENVQKPNTSISGFYDLQGILLEDDQRVDVGFHFKRTQLISSDIVRHVHMLWTNQKIRTKRLYLISDGSIQTDAYTTAKELGVDIWSGFSLFSLKYPSRTRRTSLETREINLSESLQLVKPGKSEWSAYQRLSCDIFTHLFCPPLEAPRFENNDEEKRNRRDMVFENSSDNAYWKMLRNIYKADYIVVDAKNYSLPIDKQPVIDIAHYLKPYGCGLFGILLTRYGANGAAKHAIREQWTSGNKLILVFDDTDLLDMLKMKVNGNKPEELIRIKIADVIGNYNCTEIGK